MPHKKLFLDIASPRRTSPVIALPNASIQQDSHTVRRNCVTPSSGSLVEDAARLLTCVVKYIARCRRCICRGQ